MEVLEPNFKSDQEGRIVFFPEGIWHLKSVGYIIPNDEKKQEVRKIYKQYTYQLLTVWCIGMYFHSSYTFLLVFGGVGLFKYAFDSKIKKITQDLQVSDMCLPPRNKREGWTIGTISALAMFAPLTIIGFLFSIKLMGIKGLILYTSALFVAVLALVIMYYRSARKKGEAAEQGRP
jgi:hypothetical protein